MKHSSRSTNNIFYVFVAILTFIALCIFIVTLKDAVIAAPNEPELPDTAVHAVATSTSQIKISSQPQELSIPSLGIHANVQHVGISIHGTMAVPTNFTDVGWYRYGTIPGNVGNAVMAGHLDNGLSLPGVFKHLDTIHNGDAVYITTQAGDILHFIVIGTSTLDYDTQATESVFGPTTQPLLKLITCEGTWVPGHKTYSNRLVVTALFVGTTTQAE